MEAAKKFSIGPVETAIEANLFQGAYVILLDALTVPPHLLVSVDGALYSITVNGQQVDSPLENLLALIQRKKIPTLFVAWKLPATWTNEQLKNELRKNSSRYARVEEGKVSCLYPIRDTAAAVFGEEMRCANFIFELFPLLKTKNALGKTTGSNMEHALDEQKNFELLTYTEEELKDAILAAKRSRIEISR